MKTKPSPSDSDRLAIPMSQDMIRAIDDFRYRARIPNRSEAVRQLVAAGLVAKGEKAPAS